MTSVKDILTVNVSCGGITKDREINILMLYIKKRKTSVINYDHLIKNDFPIFFLLRL